MSVQPWTGVEEIIIGARSGFCYGVREAIDAARIGAADRHTQTLGQIVHNPGIAATLEADGVGRIESSEEAVSGAAVVIRAHGVTPAIRTEMVERGIEIIDGTCAWVVASQRAITSLTEEGYTIVLLGTPGHPETVGLLGFAPEAIVVDDETQWATIPRRKKMALLAQSTQPPWKFEKLAAQLVGRSHELKVINTVCPVTIRRRPIRRNWRLAQTWSWSSAEPIAPTLPNSPGW